MWRGSGSRIGPIFHVPAAISSRRSARYPAKKIANDELGELAGLEVDRSEAHPDLGAADRVAEAGHQRQEEQHRAAGEQGPLVTRQVGGPLDEQQRGDERPDRDEAPRRLQAGEALVEAGDHHVADAVQEDDERQQRAVGAAGEQTDGDVGGCDEPEDDREERDDPGRDDRVGAERGDHVGGAR